MANWDNAGIMKRIMSVLIALLAFSLLMPTMFGMAPLLVNNPKNLSVGPTSSDLYSHEAAMQALYTTPTVSSFLNESWIPGKPINNTQMNSSPSIYGTPGVIGGEAPGSIIGFLANDSIPTAPPVQVAESYGGTGVFKLHQMN